ncbi:cytochrome b-c1 complex subunit 7-like [Physella acuta]|uniref:cytochrome b-c1 complex subunit 7-like n=1 Tax=Physella acuta TaxID=109671 RepID=UPI0027DB0952|nr:cytochrome b-c1 complex subunit 7-like [Physella acuta]
MLKSRLFTRSLIPTTMAAPVRQAIQKGVDRTSLGYKIRRWCYYKSYFPELGLRKDDIIVESPETGHIIKEALRRIPKEEFDARNFRILRASQLSMTKTTLPRNQWTVYEEDEPYLQPHIDEVLREMKERKHWDSV